MKDSVKFILKAKPKRESDGHYFNGFFEVGNQLIGISISVNAKGQVIYTSDKGGGQEFIYATATNFGTSRKKTMSKGYSNDYKKRI